MFKNSKLTMMHVKKKSISSPELGTIKNWKQSAAGDHG